MVDAFERDLENRDMDLFYSVFTKHFKDKSDFEACLNNLNAEKSNIARLGFFYYVATEEIGHAAVVLISIFSIMEATATEEFKPFDQWLYKIIKGDESITYPITDQNHFKKLILSLQKKYYLQYGSSQKVRNFIDTYFGIEDKQSLIGGIQINNKQLDIESLDLDNKLKIIVNILYDQRNAFVHKARLPQISDQNVKMFGACKVRNKETFVSIKISINEIKSMFEKAFVKLIKERGTFNQRLQKDH